MTRKLASRPTVLIGLATAFSLLGDQMLYSVLPTYFTSVGLVPYQVGVILSANRFIRLITNHLAEQLCRRVRLGALTVLAFGVGALVTYAYAVVTHFGLLVVARLTWGLCWSFIRQIGLMTVVESNPDHRLGRSMGFYSGISRTGSLAGNLLGAVGHDLLGYTTTLIGFSCVSVLAIPLGLFGREGLKHRTEAEPDCEGDVVRSGGLLFCGFAVGCVGSGLVMSTLGLVLKHMLDTIIFIVLLVLMLDGHIPLGQLLLLPYRIILKVVLV